MLPKSRIFSVLQLGLGVALIAAGLAASSFLSFSPRLPLDIEGTTWTMHDENATAQALSAEGVSQYEGPMTYQLNMDIQEPADKDTATLRVGESAIRGGTGNVEDLSFARVWAYPVDRLSGKATGPAALSHTMGSPTAEVPVEGYWLKLPADAEQTTYPVFDPVLRTAADAVFEESLDIDGRTVYRYRQEIEPTNVATLYAGNTTTTLSNEDGSTEQGYLFHSATRDLFVDQATGLVVGMDVDVRDYWADREGNEREVQFAFTGATDEQSRAELLQQAERFPRSAVGQWVRWGGVGSGALLVLFGALGAFRRPAQRHSR